MLIIAVAEQQVFQCNLAVIFIRGGTYNLIYIVLLVYHYTSEILFGNIGQYSLDPEVAAGNWRFEASDRSGGPPILIAAGTENVEDDVLGTWSDAAPALDHRLQTTLTDGLGRRLIGNIIVPGSNARVR